MHRAVPDRTSSVPAKADLLFTPGRERPSDVGARGGVREISVRRKADIDLAGDAANGRQVGLAMHERSVVGCALEDMCIC